MAIDIKSLLRRGKYLRSVRQTFHADVEIWDYNQKIYVVKKIGSNYNHLTAKEVVGLQKKINYYYRSLKCSGVPVPKEFTTDIVSTKRGNFLINVSSYCGKSARVFIENGDFRVWKVVVRGILNNMAKVFSCSKNKNTDWLSISIEASPDNFAGNSWRSLVYIDFTPPLLKEKGFPPNTLRLIPKSQLDERKEWKDFRYFNKKGVMLTFLTKMWAARPEFSNELKKETSAFLRKRGENQIWRYLFNSSAQEIKRLVDLIKLSKEQGDIRKSMRYAHLARVKIKSFRPGNRDLLRLTSLEIIPSSIYGLLRYLKINHGFAFYKSVSSQRDLFREIFYGAYKNPGFHKDFQSFLQAVVDYYLSK